MASPPESSRARLLKLRRVHVEFVRRNRDRELRWLLPGKLRHRRQRAFLVIGRPFRLCSGQRFRCDFDRHSIGGPSDCLHKTANRGTYSSTNYFGGVLASTHRWKRRRHVEDGSLASLKTEPKQINADHQDLALAA